MKSFAEQIVGNGDLGFDSPFEIFDSKTYRNTYGLGGLTKRQNGRLSKIAKEYVQQGKDREYFRHRMNDWLQGKYEKGYEKYPKTIRSKMLGWPIALFPYAKPMAKRNLLVEADALLGERTLFTLRNIQMARMAICSGEFNNAKQYVKCIWGPTARAAESSEKNANLLLEWLHIRTGSSWEKRVALIRFGTKHDVTNLWNRVGNRCEYCRSELHRNEVHVDHIRPVVYAGMDIPSNWAISCKKCNLSKSSNRMSNWNPEFLPVNHTHEENWTQLLEPINCGGRYWFTVEW